MNQLDMFSEDGVVWSVWVDGAARGNPGPAGAGVFIQKNNESVLTCGFYLGEKTNNQAEYYALLLGCFFLESRIGPQDILHIYSDSQLLTRQLTGVYAIKNVFLKDLAQCVRSFLRSRVYAIYHVVRSKNTIADSLANQGIDKKIPVPVDFKKFCERYR